jgi:hypothetical protein
MRTTAVEASELRGVVFREASVALSERGVRFRATRGDGQFEIQIMHSRRAQIR